MTGPGDPYIRETAELLLQGTLAALTKPESANAMATFVKNYYDALVQKGFAKEEALGIVVGHGIPTLRH